MFDLGKAVRRLIATKSTEPSAAQLAKEVMEAWMASAKGKPELKIHSDSRRRSSGPKLPIREGVGSSGGGVDRESGGQKRGAEQSTPAGSLQRPGAGCQDGAGGECLGLQREGGSSALPWAAKKPRFGGEVIAASGSVLAPTFPQVAPLQGSHKRGYVACGAASFAAPEGKRRNVGP